MVQVCGCIFVGGCRKPAKAPVAAATRAVPAAAHVASVQITVTAQNAAEPRCTFAVNNAKAVASVVALLQAADWTQMGMPLAEISLEPPGIEFVLLDRGEQKHTFAFYWEGNSIIGDGRLIETDLRALRQFVIDLLVRHNCGDDRGQADEERQIADSPPRAIGGGLPGRKVVAAIEIITTPAGSAAPQCKLRVEDDWSIGNAVAWLQKIDWEQEGTPLSRMQIIQPDIEMALIEIDGAAHRYQFYWQDAGFIDLASGRFLQADVSGLRRLVSETIVATCAARTGTPTLDPANGRTP
jgi:hypothetical protein